MNELNHGHKNKKVRLHNIVYTLWLLRANFEHLTFNPQNSFNFAWENIAK